MTNTTLYTTRKANQLLSLLKGSRQPESRGVGNVSICPNFARTAAIDVLFSINFAVVFDFIYFRFRPSKAKWIGNVLPDRRNAAIRSMFIFLLYNTHCLLTHQSVCVLKQWAASRKKIREIKIKNLWRSRFVLRCLLAQGASLGQYIGAGITFFNFPLISLSPFSQLSPSPNLYIYLPISISLAISISLPISISLAISSLPLSPTTEKHKIFITGRTICCVLLIHRDIA